MIFLTEECELSFKDKVQVLYFYANWMPFHKKMLMMLNKMETKYSSAEYLAVNVDEFKGFCKRFNIKSIPEIIIFKNKEEVKRANGVMLTSALNSLFVEIYNDK